MAKMVLVWHDVSEQFVEIDERHLAHPILGPHYHIARVNDDGKPYVPGSKEKARARGKAEAAAAQAAVDANADNKADN
jgi:hypothetical protein